LGGGFYFCMVGFVVCWCGVLLGLVGYFFCVFCLYRILDKTLDKTRLKYHLGFLRWVLSAVFVLNGFYPGWVLFFGELRGVGVGELLWGV